jgi:hypothetical protein
MSSHVTCTETTGPTSDQAWLVFPPTTTRRRTRATERLVSARAVGCACSRRRSRCARRVWWRRRFGSPWMVPLGLQLHPGRIFQIPGAPETRDVSPTARRALSGLDAGCRRGEHRVLGPPSPEQSRVDSNGVAVRTAGAGPRSTCVLETEPRCGPSAAVVRAAVWADPRPADRDRERLNPVLGVGHRPASRSNRRTTGS